MPVLGRLRQLLHDQPSRASHEGAVLVLLNAAFVVALVIVGLIRFSSPGAAAIVFAAPLACTSFLLFCAVRLVRLKVDEPHWRRANEVNRQLTAAILFLILYSAVNALQDNAFATAASAFVIVGVALQAVGPGYTAYREAIEAAEEAETQAGRKKKAALHRTNQI